MADLAVLALEIDPTGYERGAKRVETVTEEVMRRMDQLVSVAKRIGQQLGAAFSGTGTGRQQSLIESGFQRHQQRITQIQTIAEATAQRHQQRVVQIESVKAAQLSAIFARRETAEARHQQRLNEIAAREAARRSRPNAAGAGVAAALTGAGAALSAGALVSFGREAIESAANIDSITRALVAVSGSSQAAAEQLARLREVAKLPGIDFQGAVQGSVRLQAVGFSAAESERALRAFANAIATTGGGAGELQSVTIQLAQLSSKGKVLAQDLRPIIEAAPVVGKALKNIFGTVDSEQISKALEKAGKSSKDFIGILLAELERLPKVTGGPREALTNFSTTVSLAFAKAGDAILRLLVPVLEKLGPLIERAADSFAKFSPAIQSVIVIVGTVAAAIGPALLAFGSLAFSISSIGALFAPGAILGSGGALAGVGAFITASLGPIGIAIAAIAAAVALFAVAWKTNFGGIREVTASVVSFIQERFTALMDFWREIAPLLREVLEPVLKAIIKLFDAWSENVKAIIVPLFEFIKTYIRTVWGTIGDIIKAALQLLTGRFEAANQTILDLQRNLWEGIKTLAARGLLLVVDVIKQGLLNLAGLDAVAKLSGENLGRSLVNGIVLEVGRFAPILAAAIAKLLTAARAQAGRDEASRVTTDAASAARAFAQSNNLLDKNLPKTTTAPPPSPFPLAGKKEAPKSRESELRAIRQAELALERAALEARVALIKDANERELKVIQGFYDRGLLSTRQFYDAKLKIIEATINSELSLIQQEIAQVEGTQAQAKRGSAEQLRLEKELLELRSKLLLKTRELGDASVDSLREFKRALGELKEDLSQVVEINAQDILTPIQQEVRNLMEQLQSAVSVTSVGGQFRKFDIVDLELRRQEIAIQNQIERGVLTEAEGRRQILAVQRQYRGQLIEILEAERRRAELLGQLDEVGRLDTQIEELRNVGLELGRVQQIFKGIGDDSRDLINNLEEVGRSIRQTFVSSFERAFREGPKAFFQNVLQGFADLLSRLAAEILTSQLTKLLGNIFKLPVGQPRGPGGTPPFNPNAGTGIGGGIKDTITGALGLKKAAADTVLPQIAGSVTLIQGQLVETVVLLREIAAFSRESVSCCRAAEQNEAARASYDPGGLSKVLGLLAPLAGSLVGLGLGGLLKGGGGDEIGSGFSGAPSGGYFVGQHGVPLRIKGRANGGWGDGDVLAGEYGPELIHFPRPGYVFNAQETKQMLNGEGNSGEVHHHNEITIHVHGVKDAQSFRDSEDQIMARLAAKLARTARNQ